MTDAVGLSDRRGRTRVANEGAVWIFGVGAAQSLGESLDIMIPARGRQRHWGGYCARVEAGRSAPSASELLNVPALNRKKETISIQFTVAPITGKDGTSTGIISLMRDFTEVREELRRLRTLENGR